MTCNPDPYRGLTDRRKSRKPRWTDSFDMPRPLPQIDQFPEALDERPKFECAECGWVFHANYVGDRPLCSRCRREK
jgi:hypothetical protein